MSSSSRPWIDVVALPEKFNMAVTESDLDPKVRKNGHNFLMSVRPLSWACGHGTEVLLWQPKEMSHDFVRGQLGLSHWG